MSLHLEGVVGMKESFVVHSVSHLVSMVSYMYVTWVTAEFRYSSFVLSTFFTIMIMTSSVMVMIMKIISYQYNMCKRKRVTFTFGNGWPYIVYHTALQLL